MADDEQNSARFMALFPDFSAVWSGLDEAAFRLENAVPAMGRTLWLTYKAHLEGTLDDSIQRLVEKNDEKAALVIEKAKQIELQMAEIRINLWCFEAIREVDDTGDYKLKRERVKTINQMLRAGDFALQHPDVVSWDLKEIGPEEWDEMRERDKDKRIADIDSYGPKSLYAIASYDGCGRYTFEDREDKKRSGSYKSLRDILPLRLTKDLPRKEGFIERRKNVKPE